MGGNVTFLVYKRIQDTILHLEYHFASGERFGIGIEALGAEGLWSEIVLLGPTCCCDINANARRTAQ